MVGVTLNKENLKGVLDELKARYGDVKISEISKKLWDDDDFKALTLINKIPYGKRVKIQTKSEGVKGIFRLGKKI